MLPAAARRLSRATMINMRPVPLPQPDSRGFPGRLGIRQRVLADYRARLFDAIAPRCAAGLSVLAGEPLADESIHGAALQVAEHAKATNRHLFPGAARLHWQPELLDWLQRTDPLVMITDANPRIVDSARAIAWMRRRGRAVLGWGLGTLQLTAGLDAIRLAARRRHFRQFDGFIAYSQVAAEQYAAIGVPASRIHVAHNAALPPPQGACPERPTQFEPRARVLFIGRLIDGKRLEDLLQACRSLDPTQAPELQVVGDGPLRAGYEALAARLYPTTRFLGAQRGAELAALCRCADLFVLPGKGGLAIQEAMCYGLPIVATHADGTERDLVRPENGWLFEEGNVASLTAVLREALAFPARLRAMGHASFRIVRDEINLHRMADEFLRAASAFT
jgi:glycosyltransferase involved in cell wall biosynthesis